MIGLIKSVEQGSIADEIGLKPGDKLLKVNNKELNDILDYKFYTSADEYEIEIEKQDGEIEVIEIVNEYYEQLGLEFENDMLGKTKVCHNKCVFCFVDQLPKNMRKTLYVKDDDYRLSALMGNYVTLTNVSRDDIERIINLHLPRINISVHATDRAVREKLLNNKNADIYPIMKRFAEAGIYMDCQVVLCRDLNDGKILDKTIKDCAALYPFVQSLSVVPVGMTDYRENLSKLKPFTKETAEEVILQIEKYRKQYKEELGTSFVFASDEFYVKAEHKLLDSSDYEDFLQLENGVGLLALQKEEFLKAKECLKNKPKRKKTIATGVSAAPYIKELVDSVTDSVRVIPIINNFLGESITVSGLLTGKDIIEQLKGEDLGEELLIPAVMINYDGVFIDDLCPKDIEKALNIKVVPVENDGEELLNKLF